MRNQDWKLKYQDLKLKFHDAVDVAFRLGMEQGLQQAQVQQVQQQQADAQAAQAAAIGGQPGQPGEDPNAPPGQEQTDGSELDQHIGQLEGMLSQSQSGSPEQAGLQKSLNGIKAFRSTLKQAYELKKSEQAIKAISKAMKSPFTLSKTATKNLTEHGRKGLSDQEKIVEELMKSMSDEEAKAKDTIIKTLDYEQLLKG